MSVLKDEVDHPQHYNMHPSGIECIDIVRHFNYNVGSAIKYLWRNGLKPRAAAESDLLKAAWFCCDEVYRLTGKRYKIVED